MNKRMLLVPMLVAGLFTSAPVLSGATAEEKIIASLEKRSAPRNARMVIASLPVNATVADLFVSKKRGHVGFNIPTLPMSVSRSFLLPAPMKMKSYKLFYKLACGAEITAAGFWRFITNAHVLFYSVEKKRLPGDGVEYLNTVKEAIDAHKAWYVNQTEETRLELNKKEDAVMKLLAKLPLSNSKTRFLVEQLLSTCMSDHKRVLRRATMSNSPKRLNAHAHPKGFIRTCAENLGVNVGVTLAVPVTVAALWAVYDFFVKGKKGVIVPCWSKPAKAKGGASQKSGSSQTDSVSNGSSNAGFLDAVNQKYGNKVVKPVLAGTVALTVFTFAYLWGKDIYDWKTDYNLVPEPFDGGIKVVIKLDPFLS